MLAQVQARVVKPYDRWLQGPVEFMSPRQFAGAADNDAACPYSPCLMLP